MCRKSLDWIGLWHIRAGHPNDINFQRNVNNRLACSLSVSLFRSLPFLNPPFLSAANHFLLPFPFLLTT